MTAQQRESIEPIRRPWRGPPSRLQPATTNAGLPPRASAAHAYIDIETIGAGGGSIASVQLGHVLKVGPQSAGAHPGPACYDRGGSEPTLTDALVVLGHLNPGALLAGAMPIASAKAREAVITRVANPLGISPIEAAWGILRVLATNVMVAMRTITVERGYDPREFTLVPFGGMGPTIAGLIAAELGISRILIPRDPGTFSAHGMLVTDVHQQRSLTRITPVDGTTAAELDAIFAAMEADALQDLLQEQIPRERLETVRHAGMRYRGQSYEVAVPVPSLHGPGHLADLIQRFHDAHQRRYGHMAQAEAVEIVNFQVTAIGRIPKPATKRFDPGPQQDAPSEIRRASFSATDACDVPVLRAATCAPAAYRRAGGDRRADVDHRALSGTARDRRRRLEHRDRGAIVTSRSDARGRRQSGVIA